MVTPLKVKGALRRLHLGPGDHPSGSPQSVHAGNGKALPDQDSPHLTIGYNTIREWAGGNEGFIDGEKFYRVYHGSSPNNLDSIMNEGLRTPEGVGVRWYMVTTSLDQAAGYARDPGIVIEYRIPTGEMPFYLWPGAMSSVYIDFEVPEHSLRNSLPNKFIVNVHEVKNRRAINTSSIERGGPGSGNFGHAGRPGKVGGSAPSRESGINLPLARKIVDGRTVTENIPNVGSISATFTNWDELQGIREVKFSDLGAGTDKPKFATARQRKAAESLAKLIKDNGWIDPLIIVYDRESAELGPYILEGATRFDALQLLDAVSFPALVVIDRDPQAGSVERGGPGSGHYGHAGRPGKIGGSSSSSEQENDAIILPLEKGDDEIKGGSELGASQPRGGVAVSDLTDGSVWQVAIKGLKTVAVEIELEELSESPATNYWLAPDGAIFAFQSNLSHQFVAGNAINKVINELSEEIKLIYYNLLDGFSSVSPSYELFLKMGFIQGAHINSVQKEIVLKIDNMVLPTEQQNKTIEDLFSIVYTMTFDVKWSSFEGDFVIDGGTNRETFWNKFGTVKIDTEDVNLEDIEEDVESQQETADNIFGTTVADPAIETIRLSPGKQLIRFDVTTENFLKNWRDKNSDLVDLAIQGIEDVGHESSIALQTHRTNNTIFILPDGSIFKVFDHDAAVNNIMFNIGEMTGPHGNLRLRQLANRIPSSRMTPKDIFLALGFVRGRFVSKLDSDGAARFVENIKFSFNTPIPPKAKITVLHLVAAHADADLEWNVNTGGEYSIAEKGNAGFEAVVGRTVTERHGVHIGQEGRPGVAGGSQPGFKHVKGGENWQSTGTKVGGNTQYKLVAGLHQVVLTQVGDGESWILVESNPETGGFAEKIGEFATAEEAVAAGNKRISEVGGEVFNTGEFVSVRFGDLAQDMADNPNKFDANVVNSVLAGDTGKIIDQRIGENGEQQFKIDFDGAEVWVNSDELRFQDDPSAFSPSQFRKTQGDIEELSMLLANRVGSRRFAEGQRNRYDHDNLQSLDSRLDQAIDIAEEEWRDATDERKEFLKGNIDYEYSRLAERIQYLSENNPEYEKQHRTEIEAMLSTAQELDAPLIAPKIMALYEGRDIDIWADTDEGIEEQFARLYAGIENDHLRREAIRAHVGALLNDVFQAPLNSPDLEQKAIEMYFDQGAESPQIDRRALSEILTGEGELSRDAQMAIVTSYARAVNDTNSMEFNSLSKVFGDETSEWAALNRGLDLIEGQWIPPDAALSFEESLGRTQYDISEMAQWMNDGWKDSTAKPGSIMMSQVASELWGGESIPEDRYDKSRADFGDNFDWLLDDERRARATLIISDIYDNTQQQLRDSGIDPDETVVLYRGMNTATSEWNVGANESGDFDPDTVYGEGQVEMWSLSSWSSDPDVAYGFSGPKDVGAVLVAAVPAKNLIANANSGWPCKSEDEWIVNLSGDHKVMILNPTGGRDKVVQDAIDAALDLDDPSVRRAKKGTVLHIDEIDWPWIGLWLKKDGHDRDTIDGLTDTPIFEKKESKVESAVNRFMKALERLFE